MPNGCLEIGRSFQLGISSSHLGNDRKTNECVQLEDWNPLKTHCSPTYSRLWEKQSSKHVDLWWALLMRPTEFLNNLAMECPVLYDDSRFQKCDSYYSYYIQILRHICPNLEPFYDIYIVKFGCDKNWIKISFLVSVIIIQYCPVLGFHHAFHCLPKDCSKNQ